MISTHTAGSLASLSHDGPLGGLLEHNGGNARMRVQRTEQLPSRVLIFTSEVGAGARGHVLRGEGQMRSEQLAQLPYMRAHWAGVKPRRGAPPSSSR